MENERILAIFKNIGLEDKEAEIYLAVLRLGKATVSEIARVSGVKRTTIYQYIDALVNKNLFFKTTQGKRVYFVAENPENVILLLDKKKKELESILPAVKNLYALSSKKPQVRFYEGIDGMRTIYREITSTHKPIYGMFSADKYRAIFSEKDNEEFFRNIRESGGEIKDMVENTPYAKKYIKGEHYNGVGSTKILPIDIKIDVNLIVAGDKVAMISLTNLIGVIIENHEIAEIQRTLLKFMRSKI